jgi:3-isopropylmalate/(R)-2-methylmalate dehydratase small subunit
METIVRGKCWKFGDNFPTDLITPKERLSDPLPEMAKHVFETYNPEISKSIKRNDILVGGRNFGCSSSRLAAVRVLGFVGIGAIVVESVARTFYRNCVSLGIPVIECKGISQKVNTGDELEVDIPGGVIKNLTTGETIHGTPVPEYALKIVEKGGIVPFLRERGLLK